MTTVLQIVIEAEQHKKELMSILQLFSGRYSSYRMGNLSFFAVVFGKGYQALCTVRPYD
jgi:hypothetical protein